MKCTYEKRLHIKCLESHKLHTTLHSKTEDTKYYFLGEIKFINFRFITKRDRLILKEKQKSKGCKPILYRTLPKETQIGQQFGQW